MLYITYVVSYCTPSPLKGTAMLTYVQFSDIVASTPFYDGKGREMITCEKFNHISEYIRESCLSKGIKKTSDEIWRLIGNGRSLSAEKAAYKECLLSYVQANATR